MAVVPRPRYYSIYLFYYIGVCLETVLQSDGSGNQLGRNIIIWRREKVCVCRETLNCVLTSYIIYILSLIHI